jgi:membrane-bound serine protease (ClpP class)
MYKVSILFIFVCLALAITFFAAENTFSTSEPAQESNVVFSITVDGGISPFVSEYIKSAINTAQKENAKALLINLDTPGGLYDTTRQIVQDILVSLVPVIVYVSPAGARAGSAGVFIALSAHIVAMAPSTNIGAAHPVGISGGDVEGDMKEKVTNDAKAWARSISETRGKNGDWAEKAVEGSESITAIKALEINVIDLIATDINDLFNKIDKKTFGKKESQIKLDLKDIRLVEFPMTTKQKFMKFLSNPNLIYILLLLGILGVFIEFQSPGLVIPGLFGVLCLATVFGVQVLPINWFGALFIFAAAAFFIAEIFITSFGVLSIFGLILLILGSYLLFSVEGSGFFVEPLIIWLFSTGFAIIIFIIGLVLLKARRQGATSNVDAMVGETGTIKEEIFPPKPGTVLIRGSYWHALADEKISVGEQVIVKKINSTKVYVKKLKG